MAMATTHRASTFNVAIGWNANLEMYEPALWAGDVQVQFAWQAHDPDAVPQTRLYILTYSFVGGGTEGLITVAGYDSLAGDFGFLTVSPLIWGAEPGEVTMAMNITLFPTATRTDPYQFHSTLTDEFGNANLSTWFGEVEAELSGPISSDAPYFNAGTVTVTVLNGTNFLEQLSYQESVTNGGGDPYFWTGFRLSDEYFSAEE